MKESPLSSGWTVEPVPTGTYKRAYAKYLGPIPATVPGHVHLDLVANGVLADPLQAQYEISAAWVDELDWRYQTNFSCEPGSFSKQVLIFEGVDTVCEVWLNGEHVATHDNFYLPFEIDVTGRLRATNELVVVLRSAPSIGDERRKAYFGDENLPWDRPNFEDRAFIRKPGYMFGWDWGPRLVSCGIWQPVRLLEFDSRITDFQVKQEWLGDTKFRLRATVTIEGDSTYSLTCDGTEAPDIWEMDGALWWPNGEGLQPLHTVTAMLPSGHSVTKRIGLRTIEFVRQPDEIGTSFEFHVNGRPIWARGANWIPLSSFPSQVTRQEYFEAVGRYTKLGMNMLRVWGGGYYETDDFYDACDHFGILVWQDFLFACSYHPDDPSSLQVIEQEAIHHIKRLRDRTCLALWCGNNENRAMHYQNWGDGEPIRFHGEAIYDQILKDVIAEHDLDRAYIESSPLLVGAMYDQDSSPLGKVAAKLTEGVYRADPSPPDPLSPRKGEGETSAFKHSDDHFWDVWHGKGDWTHYSQSQTRFASEFGFASSCSLACWQTVAPNLTDPGDPIVRWHDKTGKPWETFRSLVELHYPPSESLEDWVYYSQLNQRDAMRAAIEHYRFLPGCKGALIWQANDCWPVQSWALEDYLRLVKPAGFELIRLYAPLLISTQPSANELEVWVANDSYVHVSSEICMQECQFNGSMLKETSLPLKIAPGERLLAATIKPHEDTLMIACVLAGYPETQRWQCFKEPKHLTLKEAPLKAFIDGDQLLINIDGLVRDLVVWDDANPWAILQEKTGLTGWHPLTACNQQVTYMFAGQVTSLQARSLAGRHEISVQAI